MLGLSLVILISRKIGAQLIAMVFRVLSRKHVTAYPHTKEVLAFLKEQGCRIYLLSNAQAAFTNAEIDLMALRPYFRCYLLVFGCRYL